MKQWIAFVAVVMHIVVLAGAGHCAPFTRIVSPVPGQCVPGPDVTVKFEAGGMQLGRNAWNLHFKLDEEPFHVQFDGNHAHIFKNVSPGTHTVRVYAANALHEAIPGTQSIVTFSVGYWDGNNAPEPGQPQLTYNLPQGEYLGVDASDITLDFLVENVVLSPGGYQVAYYVDGRRFLVQDMCGPRHLKNLAPGHHRVRMELQDAHGDTVPGAFNSTERIILVSPDSFTKSPTGVDDGYPAHPRMDSIKGAMTMGRNWTPEQQAKRLTIEQQKQQQALTIETDAGVVGVDGEAVTRVAAPAVEDMESPVARNRAGDSVVTDEREATLRAGDFVVRQGGEPVAEEADVESETEDDASNVRRGSIVLEDADDDIEDAEAVDEPEAKADESKTEESDTESTGVRTRADGSLTKLATTASLRLADRPSTASKPAKPTTATLRVTDANTSQPKISIEQSGSETTDTRNRRGAREGERGAGARGQRGERGTRGEGRGNRGERGTRGEGRGQRPDGPPAAPPVEAN